MSSRREVDPVCASWVFFSGRQGGYLSVLKRDCCEEVSGRRETFRKRKTGEISDA